MRIPYRRNPVTLGPAALGALRQILGSKYGRSPTDVEGILTLVQDASALLPEGDPATVAGRVLGALEGILAVYDEPDEPDETEGEVIAFPGTSQPPKVETSESRPLPQVNRKQTEERERDLRKRFGGYTPGYYAQLLEELSAGALDPTGIVRIIPRGLQLPEGLDFRGQVQWLLNHWRHTAHPDGRIPAQWQVPRWTFPMDAYPQEHVVRIQRTREGTFDVSLGSTGSDGAQAFEFNAYKAGQYKTLDRALKAANEYLAEDNNRRTRIGSAAQVSAGDVQPYVAPTGDTLTSAQLRAWRAERDAEWNNRHKNASNREEAPTPTFPAPVLTPVQPDRTSHVLAQPRRPDELLLTREGAITVKACAQVGMQMGLQNSWVYGLWTVIVHLMRGVEDEFKCPVNIQLKDRIITAQAFTYAWTQRESMIEAQKGMGILSVGEHKDKTGFFQRVRATGYIRERLLKDWHFTEKDGWTPESAIADETLPALDVDVRDYVMTLRELDASWYLRFGIPVKGQVTRVHTTERSFIGGLPEIEGLVRDPYFRRLTLHDGQWAEEHFPLTETAQADWWQEQTRDAYRSGIVGLLRSPNPDAVCYSLRPFEHTTIKLTDVTLDPKQGLDTLMGLFYPQQKVKITLNKSKDSEPVVSFVFTPTPNASVREDMAPTTPDVVGILLGVGKHRSNRMLDGKTVYKLSDIRVFWWAVQAINNEDNATYLRKQNLPFQAIRWAIYEKDRFGTSPHDFAADVRAAQMSAIPLVLNAEWREDEKRVKWAYRYLLPDGHVLIHPDYSFRMEASVILEKAPNYRLHMLGVYVRMEDWARTQLKTILNKPVWYDETLAKAMTMIQAAPNRYDGDTFMHTNAQGEQTKVKFNGYSHGLCLVTFPGGYRLLVPSVELSDKPVSK